MFLPFPISIEVSLMLRRKNKFLIKKKEDLLDTIPTKLFMLIQLELYGERTRLNVSSWIEKFLLDLVSIELTINLLNLMKKQGYQLDISGQQQPDHISILLFIDPTRIIQFMKERRGYSR